MEFAWHELDHVVKNTLKQYYGNDLWLLTGTWWIIVNFYTNKELANRSVENK